MSVKKLVSFIFILTVFFLKSDGQQVPLNPVSYKFFSPFIFNPAIAGSKDYSSINMLSTIYKNTSSQLISADTRLSKTIPGYFTSEDIRGFRNIGTGLTVFNDLNGNSRNIGAIGAMAYHIPMDKNYLSFLSFGAAVKGVYNYPERSLVNDTVFPVPSMEETFYPNLDLGVYYYNSKLFAGISATNFLGNPEDPDSLGVYGIPLSRQYFFHAGYKILLGRTSNIVLEPSVLINADDSNYREITSNIHPILKLYMMDFCVGYYYSDKSNFSFFFQYRYPRLYLGAFFELPKKSAYYIREPLIEITAGFNFAKKKTRIIDCSRW